MTKYLAGVLTVIAMGVLAVAYGLLAPGRTMSASAMQPLMAPYQTMEPGGQRPVSMPQPAVQQPMPYASVPVTYQAPMAAGSYVAQAPQMVTYVPVSSGAYVQQPVAVAPRPVQAVAYQPAPRVRPASRRVVVEREPRRDWKRTAMIVGGSTAAGAGVGGIFGGKKGALIGAAIAGGASTIYQTSKRD